MTPDEQQRLTQATRWYMRLQEATPSARALELWKRWEAVPENRRIYDELEQKMLLINGVPRPRMPALERVDADRYEGTEPIDLWLERQRKAGGHRHQYRWMALAATVLVLVAAGGFWAKHVWQPESGSADVAVYETPVAQRKEVSLTDGSKIQLGAKTSVSTNLSEHARTVVLNSGEALFEVARDSRRPFSVIAGNGTITAIGTAFNVRRQEDNSVVVTVTDGVVQIAQNVTDSADKTLAPARRVERGQQVTYSVDGRVSDVRAVNSDLALAWRHGQLRYELEPLRSVIPDLNRYSHRAIVLGDRAAGERLFTGTVLETGVDDWIANLETVYSDLEVTITDANNVLIRSRAGSAEKGPAEN